ncbi:hypothetical protein [Bacillus rhizoplanae]|uniref:hypothetical protein n=1 Tax=Bacillus rhizoplanae TaxID=2880966 RepID=UPI003D23B27E
MFASENVKESVFFSNTLNEAKDTFSFIKNGDRSNQYSPHVFDGDLNQHEDKGGYLIKKHVGKTN